MAYSHPERKNIARPAGHEIAQLERGHAVDGSKGAHNGVSGKHIPVIIINYTTNR